MEDNMVGPHGWARKGWRWWLCQHCFAPKPLHPRRGWVKARATNNNEYYGPTAPHFKEGW